MFICEDKMLSLYKTFVTNLLYLQLVKVLVGKYLKKTI